MLRFFAFGTCTSFVLLSACAGEVVPLGGENALRQRDAGPVNESPSRAADAGPVKEDEDPNRGALDGGPADAVADVDDADIDAGDADVDAGVFTCGTSVCTSTEYCEKFYFGVVQVDGGPGMTETCKPLSSSTTCQNNPTCASCGFSNCTGVGSGCTCADGNGQLRVSVYGI